MTSRIRFTWRKAALFAVAAGTVVIIACSINPATGQRQLTLIGEQQEIAIGRDNDQKIAASLGLYNDEALQNYVNEVGQRLAALSERPHLDWHFKVLDDPAINAFALPGGYVYMTRGILAHFGSEAQMVSVLGHEIGHVTARHSVEQMSRAQLAQLGLGVAMMMNEEARKYGQLAQLGLGIMMLKFSRDDESQSDDLGLRYLTRAGYDPSEMPPVFEMLGRQSVLHGGQRLPIWQSTHPDPNHRAARLRQQINALPEDQRSGTIERDNYLARLEDLPFGSDPREGYTVGRMFYHPGLEFRIRFPKGWEINNQKRSVVSAPPGQGEALIALTLAEEATAKAASRAFFERQGITRTEQYRGVFFAFRAVPESQPGEEPPPSIAGLVRFVNHQGRVLRLLAYGSKAGWAEARGPAKATLASFHRLQARRYLDVEPKRISLLRLSKPMTLEQASKRYKTTTDLATIAALNNVDPQQRLAAGTTIKLVVGGVLPES